MSIYMVSAIEIFDPVIYRRYQEQAARALAPFVIDHLSGDGDPVMYEGGRPANHLNIIRFESREAFEAFYNSEAYQAAIPDRMASADTKFIMLMTAMGS